MTKELSKSEQVRALREQRAEDAERAVKEGKKRKLKLPFDRNAYQRDLMRKRRKEGKAK